MTKWLEQHKNIVLIIVLILLAISALFFIFFIRPLTAEVEAKSQELNRINEDVSFYQERINQLSRQTFSDEEMELLVGSVPATPNVEDLIKELEKTEIETGAVIDNVSISLYQNESNVNDGATAENENNQAETEAQETALQTDPQQGVNSWPHIFPEETLNLLNEKEKLVDINKLTVSYVELVIDINGKVRDIDKFVRELENFKRIIHVQEFDYTINEENGRLEGAITIRAFYSEDFEEFINEKGEFQLDYVFDPSKIKRYIEPTTIETESGSVNSNGGGNAPSQEENNSTEEENGSDSGNNSKPEVKAPSIENKETEKKTSKTESKNQSGIDSKNKVYSAPSSKREGEPEFLVVQTGAFATENNVNSAAKDLIEAGIYPRIIGDKLFYIYTATDSSDDSAQKMVDMLKNKGFDSYVKTLPYRLTDAEKDLFLTEADDLVSTTTEILTNKITKNEHSIDDEQLNIIRSKIKAYETKVQGSIKKSESDDRKKELQESLSILQKLDQLLQKSINDGSPQTLWEAEGLLLDFMLILNRYIPADLN